MTISPFKDRFGRILAITGSATETTPPEVGVSSSFDLINGAAGGMNTSKFDRFRQGVSIVSRRYLRRDSASTVNSTGFVGTIGCLPVMTSDGFDGEKYSDIHSIPVSEFGQPKLFLDNEPYEDIGIMKVYTKIESNVTSAYGGAIAYIQDEDGSQSYPVILDNVSMKYPDQLDGVIEPLAIREVISNRSAETPFVAHKVRADILGGSTHRANGSDLITQILHISSSHRESSSPFIDAAESGLSNESITLFAPGYNTDIQRKLPPFLDSKERFCKILVGTGSIRDLGMVDEHHKSQGAGFDYSNNPLGTDSIAFGGLKR
jgi:hypothetical protein